MKKNLWIKDETNGNLNKVKSIILNSNLNVKKVTDDEAINTALKNFILDNKIKKRISNKYKNIKV